MTDVRLQRFLSQAKAASRREAERLMLEGAVRVNGKIADSLGVRVDPERDRVEINGRRIRIEKPIYRLLLKPRECLSVLESPRDDAGRKRPSLERYVKDRALGWTVVGPLDFHAEGVLLLTTDGAFAEQVTRGGAKAGRSAGGAGLPMTYHLKFQGVVGDEQVARLMEGWRFEGRRCKPSLVVPLATTGKNTWVEIVVPELRPRALKAAGELVRRRLLKISRVKFGPLSFEGLKMGGHRDLNDKEVAQLRKSLGMASGRPQRD